MTAKRSLGLWILTHGVNPLTKLLLRSPCHRLLSGGVLLITYQGRKSGRTYTLPVQYAETRDALYIVPGMPERKTWWRNLTGSATVRLRVRGKRFMGRGEVLRGPQDQAAIVAGCQAYFQRFPIAARRRAIKRLPNGAFDADGMKRAAQGIVVVRVTGLTAATV